MQAEPFEGWDDWNHDYSGDPDYDHLDENYEIGDYSYDDDEDESYDDVKDESYDDDEDYSYDD